ncbi:hypothetical protein [Limnobaculum xujianqingii]|nr:hypothetical protein [Limnobaculum xujianqingii]
MTFHKLTGKDVMQYRKLSRIDHLVVWLASVGLIILAILGMIGGLA